MLKIMWVPREYKNFSFSEITDDAKRIIKECREVQAETARLYADGMVLQNKIANLTEEEARHNLSILIPYLEAQFPSLKEKKS